MMSNYGRLTNRLFGNLDRLSCQHIHKADLTSGFNGFFPNRHRHSDLQSSDESEDEEKIGECLTLPQFS